MRTINLLVIHCADTPNGSTFSVKNIDEWHQGAGYFREPEFIEMYRPHLKSVGYHFVIGLTGIIEEGRDIEEQGSHARENRGNHGSIGVCLIGRDKFTAEQWGSLGNILARFPGVDIKGHNELDPGRTCPGFDVQVWLGKSMLVPPEHLLRIGDEPETENVPELL